MIEFKYKDKLFYTTNLQKKLKRLKITENDIEILREFEEQKTKQQDEFEDWLYCYFYNSNNKNSHIIISKDHSKPNKTILLKYNIFTEEYINNLILLDGQPKFPIILDENNLPILETIYNWKD
jgi:hypothetical protein